MGEIGTARSHMHTPANLIPGETVDILGKAKELINQNDEKVDQLVEKAGDAVDSATGGKFAGAVDKAQDLIQEKTGEGDTVR